MERVVTKSVRSGSSTIAHARHTDIRGHMSRTYRYIRESTPVVVVLDPSLLFKHSHPALLHSQVTTQRFRIA
jgi:hypothetical protein